MERLSRNSISINIDSDISLTIRLNIMYFIRVGKFCLSKSYIINIQCPVTIHAHCVDEKCASVKKLKPLKFIKLARESIKGGYLKDKVTIMWKGCWHSKTPGKDYTNESVFLHGFHGLQIDGRVWFLQIERNYLANAEITQNVIVRQIIVLTYLHNFSYVIISQLLRRHPFKVGKCWNPKLIETKCYMNNTILQTAKLYSDIILVSGTKEWITWHLIMMGSI